LVRCNSHQLAAAKDIGEHRGALTPGASFPDLQVQAGDKRWFKGADRDAKGTWNSFTVA